MTDRYNTPSKGVSDWNVPLNENFSALDIDVEHRGTDANKSNIDPADGAMYRATDTGAIYLGNGSSWVLVDLEVADLTGNSAVLGEVSIGGSSPITDPAGDNLSIDGNGVLNAAGDGSGGSYAGTEAIVTDGANLQSALDNNQIVRISGNIDVSGESPITVSQDTVIYGNGVRRNAATGDSDIISDDSAGPTLHITGNSVYLVGFCIYNPNTDGTGIHIEGYSPNIHRLEVEAGATGIRCGDSATSTVETEPRVIGCRIWSETDGPLGDGTVGIHVEDMYDAKIYNNIVAGFDTGIKVDQTEAEIIGNHTYAFPRTNGMTVGLHITDRWVRATHNRFEDSIMEAGVRIENWFGDVSLIANRIQVGDSAAVGVEIATTDPDYRNIIIADNSFGTDYSYGPGDTAIDLNGANTYYSYIGGNVIGPEDTTEGLGYTNQGECMTQDESPVADNHVQGVPIYDKTDDSIKMKTPAGMVTIG